MAKLRLTLACTLSDRTRPILDGRVEVPGVEFVALPGEPEDIFRRALRDRAFEVSELSMGSHITTTARGDAPYVGVPVFLSRAFRHSAIHVRTDRGVARPEDLAGRTIALPEYQQTAALWAHELLRQAVAARGAVQGNAQLSSHRRGPHGVRWHATRAPCGPEAAVRRRVGSDWRPEWWFY